MKTTRLIAFLIFLSLPLFAQNVPPLVNYQGQLSNPDGSPLATANYQLTFKVYDAASGGNLIWGPEIFDGNAGVGHGAMIPVVQGYFNVLLGPSDINSAALAGAFNGTSRFVEVTIGNNPPIAPRQQILTTPFAFLAASAALASNVVSGINITNAVITSSVFSGNGAGLTNLTVAQLPANVLTNNQSGVTLSGAFSGNGASLNNLTPANLGAGTAGISISGNAATATTANNFSGALAGDVTGSQSATAVATVGGQTAANVAGGASAANAATSAATANAIVKRDASGSFSAGTITATSFSGNGSGLTGLNANNLSSGTVPLAQLPASILNAGNAVLASNVVSGIIITNLTLPGPVATVYSGASLLLRLDNNANFFAGPGAGNLTLSGYDNTAEGNQAFSFDTTGFQNTANGAQALQDNTTGSQNTASGVGALQDNTTGTQNTASGVQALYSNTNGSQSTAIGFAALSANTSGTQNTAIGANALYANTSGSYNMASGVLALYSNTNGSQNTANGFQALSGNTSGSYNTASGYDALSDNTTGGANTAIGANALYNNSSGGSDTAIGVAALAANTTGYNNTAIGNDALLYNTIGYQNTAVGVEALFSNTNGYNNTASGYQALYANTTGNGNTANGVNALVNNTSGTENTSAGVDALPNNTTGNDNTAFGFYALVNNTTGSENTSLGAYAGQNTTGSTNIALGFFAGHNITTGNNNIDIGHTGLSGDGGVIRIGTAGTQTSAFISGISGVTVASGVAVYVNSSGQLGVLSSSARFKTNITSMDDASDVLLSLHPVTFRYRPEIDPEHIPQFGLVAEDVDKVAPDLVARDDKGQTYTVRYEAVNAMLLNEFLKEHRKVEEQNTEIHNLQERLDALEKAVLGKKTN